MNQLFSQGTADLLLDTCSDFWDGQELMPLNEADRWGFAYRPLYFVFQCVLGV
jgi:hypothetical protein